MVRRGLVLGCGGTVGGAWQIGALAAVEQALGWDARTAEVIVGTSAGATAAAMLGSGIAVEQMVAGHYGDGTAPASVRRFFTTPPRAFPVVPRGFPSLRLAIAGVRAGAPLATLAGLLPAGSTDPAFLDALVDDVVPNGGWVDHPATWVVAVDISTGRRRLFGSPGSPPVAMRDAVRASWAVPGWYPPVRIAGSTYVDGGVASTASVDAVAGRGLDEIVVIAPMASAAGAVVPGVAGQLEALMRRSMTATLDTEIDRARSGGTRVLRVHPGAAELAVMGPNFMDPRRRLAALDCALRQVPVRIEQALGGVTR